MSTQTMPPKASSNANTSAPQKPVEPGTTVDTFTIKKEIQISAPAEIVFETLLEPQGPLAEMGLKLEAWPGGRWYRDLGNNTGHLWGHVQVIKPPKLLEIVGPMAMSYPVSSHIQYRLTEEGGGTKLTLIHRAVGLIAKEHSEGINEGWGKYVVAIKSAAEGKKKK
jgi:uncharacterized protein YndB with AHSA1/START domain